MTVTIKSETIRNHYIELAQEERYGHLVFIVSDSIQCGDLDHFRTDRETVKADRKSAMSTYNYYRRTV